MMYPGRMTNFPPPNPPFIKARHHGGSQVPKAIVLHGTVSSDDRGTARNIANWWAGPESPQSSAHYVVDPREIIQCVGDHTVAYHCGFNTGSIGVEFCDEQAGPATRWQDRDSQDILKRAATLVAELCLAYDIEARRPTIAELRQKGPHGIYGHNDSRLAFGHTTHTDPRDFPWEQFMRFVRSEIARIRREARSRGANFVIEGSPSDHDAFVCDFVTDEGTVIRAATYNGAKHDARQLERVLNALEKFDVGVALLQEIKRDSGGRDVVRDLRARGYKVIYAQPEFAIAYNPKVWEKISSRRVLMSPTEYWTFNYALVAVLRDKSTGERGKFATLHPPAHVQAPKHPSHPVVSRVLREWDVTLDKISRRNFERKVERAGGIDFNLFGGDLNFDHTKGWGPKDDWESILDGPLDYIDPPRGTHGGGRKIDKFLIRGLRRA